MNARTLDGEIITSRLDDVSAYDGVRTRRILAFLIDYLIVALLLIPFAILVVAARRADLRPWLVCCLPSSARRSPSSTSGTRSAAPTRPPSGMRMMGIRLDRLDGRPIDGLTGGRPLGAVLGRQRRPDAADPAGRRCFPTASAPLHDLLLGTVVTRSDR